MLKNIDKLSAGAGKTIKPFVDKIIKAYGAEVESIFVYGSVTGPDYNPRSSDINTAIVLKSVSIGKLKPFLKPARAALRRGVSVPLFLTKQYIEMSLDTFPIEFLTMKESRCVLFGEDVLGGIEVKKEDLRRECEYQLKGKLLTIRQAYLEQALDRKGLERLIKASFRALMPVFKSILCVKFGELPEAMDKEKVLRRLGDEFGLDVTPFLEVLYDKKRDGRIGKKASEEFLEEFLTQLGRISDIVDKL